MLHESDWRRRAECQVVDPRIFFGFDDESPGQRVLRERAAVALCNGCAARRACADFAIENEIADGVWGGLTEAMRQRGADDPSKRR